jgi:hypothetical protein
MTVLRNRKSDLPKQKKAMHGLTSAMSLKTIGCVKFHASHRGSVPNLLVDIRASESGVCAGKSKRRTANREGCNAPTDAPEESVCGKEFPSFPK